MSSPNASIRAVLQTGPPAAAKLFPLIVRQASHGPIHPKPQGVATPPEILEACGLDVGEFYQLLDWLVGHGLVEVGGEYPFEEIRLTTAALAGLLADSTSPA
jgi:hypothetical protein